MSEYKGSLNFIYSYWPAATLGKHLKDCAPACANPGCFYHHFPVKKGKLGLTIVPTYGVHSKCWLDLATVYIEGVMIRDRLCRGCYAIMIGYGNNFNGAQFCANAYCHFSSIEAEHKTDAIMMAVHPSPKAVYAKESLGDELVFANSVAVKRHRIITSSGPRFYCSSCFSAFQMRGDLCQES